jgi:hypothetical protein
MSMTLGVHVLKMVIIGDEMGGKGRQGRGGKVRGGKGKRTGTDTSGVVEMVKLMRYDYYT